MIYLNFSNVYLSIFLQIFKAMRALAKKKIEDRKIAQYANNSNTIKTDRHTDINRQFRHITTRLDSILRPVNRN